MRKTLSHALFLSISVQSFGLVISFIYLGLFFFGLAYTTCKAFWPFWRIKIQLYLNWFYALLLWFFCGKDRFFYLISVWTLYFNEFENPKWQTENASAHLLTYIYLDTIFNQDFFRFFRFFCLLNSGAIFYPVYL